MPGVRMADASSVALAIVRGRAGARAKQSCATALTDARYWAGAQARNYLARPRSGRLLFGEALARGG